MAARSGIELLMDSGGVHVVSLPWSLCGYAREALQAQRRLAKALLLEVFMSQPVNRSDQQAGSIHFLTIYLTEQIHQFGLGFTRLIHVYAWGKSESEVQEVAEAWLAGQGIDVLRFAGTSRAAVKQDLGAYTFPEQVHGAPFDQVVQAMKAKGLPDDWFEEDLKKLHRSRAFIEKGRKILRERAQARHPKTDDSLAFQQ